MFLLLLLLFLFTLGRINFAFLTNSEEIFEFSLGEMTSQKTKKMKKDWITEFSQVFQLCVDVLSQSQRASLLHATLGTLHRFCYCCWLLVVVDCCRLLVSGGVEWWEWCSGLWGIVLWSD